MADDAPPGGFDRAAWFYEPLARIYSLGKIEAAKASQLGLMNPGDRVLYVGVGAGEDAVLAARVGADLTCIDLSGRMLARARTKFERAGLRGEFIRGDVFEHDRIGHYDVVAANFFLNCFERGPMRRMLRHLSGLVRPGGRLLIADVAAPSGNRLQRQLHRGYNGVGLALYWAMGLVPLHPIHDYRRYFGEAGLRCIRVRDFRVLPFGPVSFQAIEAQRLADPEG
ncbi:class I SAM-dependent methyltransferase [Tautonia plasticadhaerens]|uniref:Ribosomal protein L11 methyltransferase n=1 Tax=Tautonia plasticadhaerens TaxID=2527974 RepID=A0A518GX18_9BACT|nr:class I SAM-dependent methyltransferase [Tautonia plasticadhaerens]QDV33138.1 Ribosomal protein L11 methyltransferase [Tautonia plasticadhaerens]